MPHHEHNFLLDLLRNPSKITANPLGYDAKMPTQLYQASAPGEPCLDRPITPSVIQGNYRELVAAVKRTFPVIPFNEELEEEKKPPFRTAFSAIKSLPSRRPPSKKKTEVRHSEACSDDDVSMILPYVAYGPVMRVRSHSSLDAGTSDAVSASSSPHRSLVKKPKKQPLYKIMAKKWESLEAEVFSKEQAYRDKKRQKQELRVQNRQARISMEQEERAHRKKVSSAEKEGMTIVMTLEEEAKSILAMVEKEREELRIRHKKERAQRIREEEAREELLERQKQVRDRAERLVDVDRVKVEHEEQVVRSKLKALETTLSQKAMRREMLRKQLQFDEEEERKNREAQRAMLEMLDTPVKKKSEDDHASQEHTESPPVEDERPSSARESTTEQPRQTEGEEKSLDKTANDASQEDVKETPTSDVATPPDDDEGDGDASKVCHTEEKGSPIERKDEEENTVVDDATESRPEDGDSPAQDDAQPLAAEDNGEAPHSEETEDQVDSSPVNSKVTSAEQPHEEDTEKQPSNEPEEKVSCQQVNADTVDDEHSSSAHEDEEEEEDQGDYWSSIFMCDPVVLASAGKNRLLQNSTLFIDKNISSFTSLLLLFASVEKVPEAIAVVHDQEYRNSVKPPRCLQLLNHLAKGDAPSVKLVADEARHYVDVTPFDLLIVRFCQGQQPQDRLVANDGEYTSQLGIDRLEINIDPCTTLETLKALLSKLEVEVSGMEIGQRHLIVEMISMRHPEASISHEIDVHVCAPLFVIPEEGQNLTTLDSSEVSVAPTSRVSRNPHVSLDRCTIVIFSDSFPFDEWYFSDDVSVDRQPIDTTPDSRGSISVDEHAVATFHLAASRLVISIGKAPRVSNSARGEVIERCLRSVSRRIQCRKVNTQNISITISSACGTLSTSQNVHIDAEFTKPPLFIAPSTPVVIRPRASGKSWPLLVTMTAEDIYLSHADVNATLSISLPVDQNIDLSMENLKDASCYREGGFLYDRLTRSRVAIIEVSRNRVWVTFIAVVSRNVLLGIFTMLHVRVLHSAALGSSYCRVVFTPSPDESTATVDVLFTVGPAMLLSVDPTSHKYVTLGETDTMKPMWKVPIAFIEKSAAVAPCTKVTCTFSCNSPSSSLVLTSPFSVDKESSVVEHIVHSNVGTLIPQSGDSSGILSVELDLSEDYRILADLVSSFAFTLRTPGNCRVQVELKDSYGCTDNSAIDTVGFIGTASPSIIVPHASLNYRQGSHESLSGFQLFRKARVILPEFRVFTTCEISVELTAGGLGDGEDVLIFKDVESRKEEASSSTATRALDLTGQQLCIDGIPLGTVETSNYGSSLSLALSADVLESDLLTHVLRCITFENSDAKLKRGPRMFTLKMVCGKEEVKAKVTVEVSPTMIAIPSFGSKVITSSNAILPSITPKVVVNVPENDIVSLAYVRAQIISGGSSVAGEDKIFLNCGDTFEESNGLLSYTPGGTVSIGASYTSHGCWSLVVSNETKITGKILFQLMKNIAYENASVSGSSEPRIVEFLVEDCDGNQYYATAQIVVHVKDLPAILDLYPGKSSSSSHTSLPYVMNNFPMIVAPNASLLQCEIHPDAQPVLQVEFLQQLLPQDSLVLRERKCLSLTIGSGGIVMIEGIEVGTLNSKKAHILTVTFKNRCSTSYITAVMRAVAFKHAGFKDRQQHKKVQFNLKTKGNVWSRSSVSIVTNEMLLDHLSIPCSTTFVGKHVPLFSDGLKFSSALASHRHLEIDISVLSKTESEKFLPGQGRKGNTGKHLETAKEDPSSISFCIEPSAFQKPMRCHAEEDPNLHTLYLDKHIIGTVRNLEGGIKLQIVLSTSLTAENLMKVLKTIRYFTRGVEQVSWDVGLEMKVSGMSTKVSVCVYSAP